MATSFLKLAEEEAKGGYDADDPRRVRDAAEKAWLAVLQATDAAMERHGQFPEPGPRAHLTRHRFLERAGRRDLSDRLRAFADRLHGEYFYTGAIPEREGMDLALAEVREYLRRLEVEL